MVTTLQFMIFNPRTSFRPQLFRKAKPKVESHLVEILTEAKNPTSNGNFKILTVFFWLWF